MNRTIHHSLMASDGRALEYLVRTVEEFFLDKDCKVEVRERAYGETGAQLAEFDIVVTGRLGTTEIRWLIECRDRPSEGRAPSGWIEQLAGRQDIHGFNKVTAVSTTGFADGASEIAKKARIELRTVSDASSADIAAWLADDFQIFTCACQLRTAVFCFSSTTPVELREAADAKLAALKPSDDERFLRSSRTQKLVKASTAFAEAVGVGGFDKRVKPNDPNGMRIRLEARYPSDEHYLLDTVKGPVRIWAIQFEGRVLVNVTQGRPASVKAYKRDATGALISQSAVFPVDGAGNEEVTVEIHHLAETGDTHVVARRPRDEDVQVKASFERKPKGGHFRRVRGNDEKT